MRGYGRTFDRGYMTVGFDSHKHPTIDSDDRPFPCPHRWSLLQLKLIRPTLANAIDVSRVNRTRPPPTLAGGIVFSLVTHSSRTEAWMDGVGNRSPSSNSTPSCPQLCALGVQGFQTVGPYDIRRWTSNHLHHTYDPAPCFLWSEDGNALPGKTIRLRIGLRTSQLYASVAILNELLNVEGEVGVGEMSGNFRNETEKMSSPV
jgi:hypothetical protein